MSTQATRFGSCPFRRPLQAAVLLLLLALLPATVSAQLTTEPSVAFSYTTRSGVRRAQIRRAQIRRVFVVRGRRSVRVIWVLREFPAFRVGDGFTVTQTSSIVGDNLVWSCDVTYVNPRAPGQPRSFLMSINHGQSTNVVRTGDVVLTEGVARHFSGSIRVRQGYSPPLRRGVYSPLWREGSLTLRIDGRRESRGTFTGTWTWSSANPDPVVTPHPPVSPCSNRGSFGGGGGCGNDSRFQNICAPNPKLETYGWRTHYSAASQSSSGCSSCGGSAPGTSGSDNLLNLSHTFIPSNQASIGSSSPGVYYNFDQRIEFYDAGGDQIATLFDPISRRVYYYEYKPSESAYVSLIDVDGSAQESDAAFKLLELEDSAGNPVTHPSTIATQTVYAVVTSREGWTYKSELVDIDPGTGIAPVSRLTEVTSPTGKVQTLTYKFNQGDPALTGSPKKILQIDTIGDWQGNTASFTYDSNQQAGRWVVSDIDIVAQGHAGTVNRSLRYTYNSNGHLHQVFRDVSGTEATVGTYTYGTDSVWQAATIDMDEHFGAVPREEKLFVSQDYRTWKNGLVNQFSNALIGAADGAGIRNLIVFRDMDNPGRYRVLENNQLTEWDAGVSVIACSSYTTGTGQGYNSFTNVQYETNHPEYLDANGNPPTTEQVLLGRPAKVKDGTIRSAVSPSYDSDGNVSRIDYADTSYELWQYDANNQETYFRDREGIITLTQRNNDGQIVRVVRGLVDVSGPGSEIADTNTTPVQEIRGYNAHGQLEWEATTAYGSGAVTSPAANVRTDYIYSANKQLEKVLRPLAPGQSARPETLYQWEGERLVSMTVVRDSGNETTSYTYDSRNRLVKTTYPDSTTEEVAYTTNGLTTYRKDCSNIVGSVTRDAAGRTISQSRSLAYDSDLANVDINGTPATIFERLSDQVSTTTYVYESGESRPVRMITDGKTTEYTYDHKGRQVETLRYTGHRGGTEQAQVTRTEYQANMRFSQESQFGTVSSGAFTPDYSRKTYYGYAADGTTVRTVQVASSSTTYADNAAVMNASRPSSTSANPSVLITDAIRDLSGKIASLINPLNTTQLTAHDTLGRSLSQKPDSVNFPNLISTSKYDVWGNVTESTDPAGVETTRQYDTSGQYQLGQISGANSTSLSAKAEFTYDRSGRRKSVVAPGTSGLPDSNRTTTTFYDAACCGQTVGMRDALGHGQIRSSDPSGRVVHAAQVSDYDTHTTLLNPTDAKTNSESTTRYLDDGKVQFRTHWTQALDENVNRNLPQLAGLGKPASWGVTTQYVYDTVVGDGVGLETATGVDVLRISTSQNVAVSIAAAITKLGESVANGGADLSLSTHNGSATLVISPDEKTMQCSITDAAGRTVISALLSGPAASTPNQLLDWSCNQYDFVYNLSGVGNVEQVKQIDSTGNVVSSLSDGYGWGIGSLDQDSNLTQTEFNPGGQPLTVTNALNHDTTYVYDTLGRQTSMTTPAATTASTYNAATGQLASRADGKSESTSFQYDALGRPSIVTDRLNKQSNRTYYRTGQLATVIDAERKTTSYDYDVLGRRTELTMHAIGGGTPQETTYDYDSAGRMETATLHSGAKRELSYEFSGVLDKVDYFAPSSGTPSGTDNFTYDAFLRRTASSSGDGVTHTYIYTDRGQLDTDTTNYSSQDYEVDYDYDSRGRLNKITYPSGRVVDYGFTNRGELDTVDWDGAEIEDRAYDALGRLTSVDRAYVDETRVYDNANRVTSIANTNLGTAAYTYDANSNKLGETWTGVLSSWSFSTEDSGAADPDGYDDEDRFIRFEQSGQSKDFDLVRSDIGNINDRMLNGTSQSRSFNEVHQLTSLAGSSQTFDANGNLTASHTGIMLGWQDGNSRLNQTVVSSTSTAGIEGTNEYGYDADNKRLWKKITRSGSTAEHTVYIYAGPNCIADYDAGTAAASPEQEYIYGQTIDSLLMIAHDNNAERLNVQRNQQWSVSGLTKASDGTIAETYSYDVFGKRTILATNGTTVRTSSNYNNPYGYTSRRHDKESGLMYYRARYYHAELGRFISRDPIGYVDGMSLYRAYFAIHGVDPSGTYFRIFGVPDDDEWVWPWDPQAGWTPAWGPVLDSGQVGLDGLGMIPAVGILADLPNAAISGFRGNWGEMGMSLGAAVPAVGLGFGGAKLAGKGLKAADKIADGARAADNAADAAKAGDKAGDAAKSCPIKKPKKPKKPSGKCKTGTWSVGACGFNGTVIPGCDWTPFAVGRSRQDAQQKSQQMMPKSCFVNGNPYHHCTAFECVKKNWVPRM